MADATPPSAPRAQRRLPTKTRSGLIALPGKAAAQGPVQQGTEDGPDVPASPSRTARLHVVEQDVDRDDDVACAPRGCAPSGPSPGHLGDSIQSASPRVTEQAEAPGTQDDSMQAGKQAEVGRPPRLLAVQQQAPPAPRTPPSFPSAQGAVLPAAMGVPSPAPTSARPAALGQGEPRGMASPDRRSLPRPAPAPPSSPSRQRSAAPTSAIVLGALNCSTSPLVVSLPVKRRGSYQSLKKHSISNTSSSSTSLQGSEEHVAGWPGCSASRQGYGQQGNGGSSSNLLPTARKATHWEKFGTILVLYCAGDDCQHAERVQQQMMAEGYDTIIVTSQSDAMSAFACQEVYPDMVLVEADASAYNATQLIKQLQAQHSTAAVIVMAGAECALGATRALQAGACDYVRMPVDTEELMARIERNVQRQHCIKLELEQAMDRVRAVVSSLSPSSSSSQLSTSRLGGSGNSSAGGRGGRLGAVAENQEFEDQMAELCEENTRLCVKLAAVEAALGLAQVENRVLEDKLLRLDTAADTCRRRLAQVELQSSTLVQQVLELQACLALRDRGVPVPAPEHTVMLPEAAPPDAGGVDGRPKHLVQGSVGRRTL